MTGSAAPRFDEVIHARHRLQICALLDPVESLDFAMLREALEVSDSVLSKQLRHLTEAGYVDLSKSPHAGRTRTWLSLTPMGRSAYTGHVAALREIVIAE